MEKRQNNDKPTGYVILLAGLCVMGFSIVWMIYVFTGGSIPVDIFASPSDTLQGTNATSSGGNPLTSLFPMFNMLIWFIMAFIILAAGGRVASVGIKMMKVSLPDTVTIRETIKEVKEVPPPPLKNDEENKP